MNRRQLLRTVGGIGLGATTGCLASPNNSSISDTTLTVATTEVPARYDTSIDFSLVSEINDESTAKLEFKLVNERATDRTYTGGSAFPFVGKSSPEGLVLEHEHPTNQIVESDSCWSIQVEGWFLNATSTRLGGGETRRTTLSLWDDAAVDGCFETGDYRFESGLAVSNGDDTRLVFDVAFTVSIR